MSNTSIAALKSLSEDAQQAVRYVAKRGFEIRTLVGYAWECEQAGYSGEALVNKVWSAACNENRYGGNRAAGRVVELSEDQNADAGWGGVDSNEPCDYVDAAREACEKIKSDPQLAQAMLGRARFEGIDCGAEARRFGISRRRMQQVQRAGVRTVLVQGDLFDQAEVEDLLAGLAE